MLALVLLNLGMFGWTQWVATPSTAAPPRALSKEVEVLTILPRAATVDASMVAATGERDEASDRAGGAAAETTSEAPLTVEPAAAATPGEEDGGTVAGASEVEAPSPDGEPAAVPAPSTEPVELAGTQLVIIAAPDQPDQCASIGPFIELGQAAEFAAVIREMGLTPSQRLLESDVWVGYAVLLPPLPTRAEGLGVAQTLREAGVEDIYVEPGGELRNAVSLGLFSDRQRAGRRAAQITDLGFSPVIRDRTRTAEVYWVDFVVPSGRRVDLSRFEQPGRRLTNGECEL
jgi:hypothetical protein